MTFDFSLITNISVFLINAIDIWLIFLVFSADKKEKINKVFILMAFFMLIWVDFAYLARLPSQTDVALSWIKIAWAVTIPLFASLYFFVIYFIKEEKKYKILNKIVFGIAGLSFFITLFTNWIIEDIKSEQIWSKLIYGDGIIIFYGLVVILAFLTLFLLLKKYFHFSASERIKTQYFLIGILIFLFMNVVFNIIFPFLLNTPQYYQLGDYSTVIPLCFISYAITRHRIMGVKPILTSILVSLITILLFLDTLLFTPNFSVQILKGVSLFIFLIFGYYLIKSVREEVKRREDAEILSRAKSEFISMASHQLRTPLTAIKGYTSMMLEESYGKIEPRGKRVLSNVLTSSERLVKIIEDLLNISRIELGRMKFEKQSIDMKKMIDSIYEEMKTRAKNKGLNLIWKKPKIDFPKLNIDELKIRQVVYNIVDNAIKYTETGKIEIKLARENSNLIISISDTGRGFNKEDKHKLFELFTRGKAGTDTFVEGTGMGLFVAKKFVNLHQGKIWADSKGKNKGSVFHIELPIK